MKALSFNPASPWQQQFCFKGVKCLIVCRGPIRLEVMQVLEELGARYGILLSEKDSITYPQTLAPELRFLANRHEQVHHIPDYVGSSREERQQCIDKILRLCKQHNYTHLFAGYGFMAEDGDFVRQIEEANICFVGPSAKVIQQAGSKDEAKQLARKLNVSVTPGEDRITARTLLKKAVGKEPSQFLKSLIDQHQLPVPTDWHLNSEIMDQAEQVLQASYKRRIDLFSIEDLQAETLICCKEIWAKNPGRRLRFKHIGGGGGKGQRVIQSEAEIEAAVRAVLIEARVTGPGDNKTFLIEMNIEDTRHNEVQLLGNGQWCIELGGRDCSLQMHEQKLVELSLTEELLEQTIAEYLEAGKNRQAEVLQKDLVVLREMCKQAQDFGTALGLDNVSTFECIVEGDQHYFMEVNTRIQVEHRVTEMAYRLEFTNPDKPGDIFLVDSLVAAMFLVACYGQVLPKPQRQLRNLSGMEVRINATNQGLQPHAGGILRSWSIPIEGELRDDQGIGLRNPDTGLFQPYHLAGAYDSNVALSVTWGRTRLENLEQMARVLREMEVRGTDLQLNLSFHYGLLYWMLGVDSMVKPNTRFVESYLALCGKLSLGAKDIDLEFAWQHLSKSIKELGPEALRAFERKKTLLLRPLRRLMSMPHLLAGWLAKRQKPRWEIQDQQIQWCQNPIHVLRELYRYLHWEKRSGLPPSEIIWEDDHLLLEEGLQFYADLGNRLGYPEWDALQNILENKAPVGFDEDLWSAVQAAHAGFQVGLVPLLSIPISLGISSGYFDWGCNDELVPVIPKEFQNTEKIKQYSQALAPPPPSHSDEVRSWTGGTFYACETPSSPPYVEAGQHVEQNDVLGLLEVMKMFNPIRAEFPGTVRQVCVDSFGGTLVSRGQLLFLIEPDHPIVEEDPTMLAKYRQEVTLSLLAL